MALTQENRLIAIDTPLGPDILLLRGFTGHEAISRLFSFDLDLLSPDPEIKFEDIIGQKVTIRVRLGKEKERFFHGIISRFMQTGSDVGLANYRATMVPALWFLTRTADCRIFQSKKVPEIIQEILKENGVTDIKTVLKATYEPRDYCVQYRETDFNFVSRLMEQYGIFYFFEHEEKKHTLVLSDDLSAHQPCPEQPKVSWNPHGSDNLDEDVITSLQWEETFRFGKYAVTDYNFETPSTSLRAEVKTQIEVGGNSKYEIYDYPGEYGKKAEGDGIAKIRMQEEEAQYKVLSGSGTARVFTTGYKFTLQDYVRKDVNGDYVLTQVQHVASVGNTYTTGAAGGGNEDDYSNSFTCIPAKRPFRSPQVTPKPMVQGPQTAVVVGKSGEEIWTDKYGRVKVQFHWDRYGKMNESSSCWVRVSQNWAGKNWGAMFIPRIGQEVIVEFLEGDPDQPIITGRVYNAEQTVPYALPANQTQSGIKSNSSKGGGGSNEWRFEDKKGSEEVYLHGQKDWNILIENDKGQTIGHDEKLEVENNRTKKVGVDQSEDIGSNKTIHVGANHTETIGGNMSLQVDGNKTESIHLASVETIALAKALTIGAAYQVSVGAAMNETVVGSKTEEVGAFSAEVVGGNKSEAIGGNKSETISGNKSLSTTKNLTETVGKSRTITITEDLKEDVGGKRTEQVTKEYVLNAKKIQLVGEDQIVFKTGDAEITMKKNGDIEIKGKKIQIKGSGDVIVKGSNVKQN
jgi:type VI secretion system secreted protein VgrG